MIDSNSKDFDPKVAPRFSEIATFMRCPLAENPEQVDIATGRIERLHMTPTRIKRFRVNRAADEDARWLREVLSREGRKFGTRVELNEQGTLTLKWD